MVQRVNPTSPTLAHFLNAMGADIEGIGTSVLTISGCVKHLHGTEHTVISDDIEAGTFMVAGAITKGDVYVQGITEQQLPAVSETLVEAGVCVGLGCQWRARHNPERDKRH